MIASQRLCRTADGRIVPDGHPDAAFLVAGAGAEVPAEFEAAVSAFVKEAAQPANKAVEAPAADKARKAPAKKTARK